MILLIPNGVQLLQRAPLLACKYTGCASVDGLHPESKFVLTSQNQSTVVSSVGSRRGPREQEGVREGQMGGLSESLSLG